MTAPPSSPPSCADRPEQPPAGGTGTPPTPAPTTSHGLRIRPLGPADTPATARLHCENLDTGLFPRLGPRFVGRWHHTFISCEHGWGAVAVDDAGAVAGFVLVATDSRGYVAEVISRYRVSLAVRGAAALLSRPRVLAYFARTRAVRYGRRLVPRARAARPGSSVPPTGRTAVVHAVVVARSARGRGAGKALLQAAEETSRRAGADQIALVTTLGPLTGPAQAGAAAGGREPGAGADGFYEHLGWQPGQARTRDGRTVVDYSRPLR